MKKPLWCVRQNGLGEYLCSDLSSALRWVAQQIGKPMGHVTCVEAITLGYSLERV